MNHKSTKKTFYKKVQHGKNHESVCEEGVSVAYMGKL